MAELTTIKVPKALRERISAAAAQRSESVQAFIEHVMDEHERSQRLASVAAAIRGADADTLDSWRAETAEWESIEADNENASR